MRLLQTRRELGFFLPKGNYTLSWSSNSPDSLLIRVHKRLALEQSLRSTGRPPLCRPRLCCVAAVAIGKTRADSWHEKYLVLLKHSKHIGPQLLNMTRTELAHLNFSVFPFFFLSPLSIGGLHQISSSCFNILFLGSTVVDFYARNIRYNILLDSLLVIFIYKLQPRLSHLKEIHLLCITYFFCFTFYFHFTFNFFLHIIFSIKYC